MPLPLFFSFLPLSSLRLGGFLLFPLLPGVTFLTLLY
jgi:hypothetical protein